MKNPIKLLVVEDDQATLNVLTIILKKAGYEVISASNGKEGLARFDQSIDLILTDIEMPHMDGRKFVKNIRSYYSLNIPIIFITAIDIDKSEYFTFYGDYIIYKPISSKTLINVIESVLNDCGDSVETIKTKMKDFFIRTIYNDDVVKI